MGTHGYTYLGGGGVSGPSRLFSSLPFRGWRDGDPANGRGWVEDFIDAAGLDYEILRQRFISTTARAALLDPSTVDAAAREDWFATATTAARRAATTDTLVDLLCYIAGIPWPIVTEFTVAKRQALAQLGWALLRRKGTRQTLLRLASAIADSGVAQSWSAAAWNVAVIVPDGEPSPGFGLWVPAAGISAHTRPYALTATRAHAESRLFPAWSSLGVGFSQFRAGYSAIGEPVLTPGAKLNPFTDEHFATWPLTGWTAAGAISPAQNTTDPSINLEFTSSACQFDLTSAAAGTGFALQPEYVTSTLIPVHNRRTHRFELDYAYQPYPDGARMVLTIVDNYGFYYDPDAETWDSAAPVEIPIPTSGLALQAGVISLAAGSTAVAGSGGASFESSWAGQLIVTQSGRVYRVASVIDASNLSLTANASANESGVHFFLAPVTNRARFSLRFRPQRATSATNDIGTKHLTFTVSATSDGTSTGKIFYTLYRAGLYEEHDHATEVTANGVRLLFEEMIDAPGYATASRTSGATVVEVNDARRGSYKNDRGTAHPVYPYHGAMNGRAYQSTSTWVNLLLGSNTFTGVDWTVSNGTATASYTKSPAIVEVGTTAPRLQATTAAAYIEQTGIVANPSSKTYVGGVWVKRLLTDAQSAQPGTITVTQGSTAVTGSGTSFQAGATWQGAALKTAGGRVYPIASVAGATALTLSAPAAATETGVSFKISEVVVELRSNTTHARPFFVPYSDGWTLIPWNIAMGGGDVNPLALRIRYGGWRGADGAEVSLATAYLYDVTGKAGVLYPPVCVSPVGATGTLNPTTAQQRTAAATPCYHPLTLRPQASVVAGALSVEVVPTFDAGSQPDGTIVDVAEGAAVNRVVVRVASNALELRLWDSGGVARAASIALTTKSDPTAGQMTWRRDAAISIKARWSAAELDIAAGNGSARATGSWTASDASLLTVTFGNATGGTGQFDGLIRNIEITQVGIL